MIVALEYLLYSDLHNIFGELAVSTPLRMVNIDRAYIIPDLPPSLTD